MAYKTEIKFTVYSPEPLTYEKDLAGIVWSIDAGDSIGDWTITETSEVDGEQLRKELIAIGNDGDFFDAEDED